MRARVIPALVGVAALALTTALVSGGSASAGSAPVASTSGGSTDARTQAGPVCKKSFNLGTPNGDGVTAQNFEPDFEIYSSYGAASFKTARRKCVVKSVYVEGQGAPGSSLYIAVVGNAGGLPDKSNVKCEDTILGSGPIWKANLNTECVLARRTNYFFIAQEEANFGTEGQWFWNTTNAQVTGGDAWKNPGGGFGVGCTDWGDLGTCLGFADYEFIFALQKGVV